MRTPSLVELDAATRTLRVHWPDAPSQPIGYLTLREACRCAQCRRSRLSDAPSCSPERLAEAARILVTAVHPMGYGLQIVFSDGHDRGIFPWDYLADLPGAE